MDKLLEKIRLMPYCKYVPFITNNKAQIGPNAINEMNAFYAKITGHCCQCANKYQENKVKTLDGEKIAYTCYGCWEEWHFNRLSLDNIADDFRKWLLS